jgi:integrase
MNKRTVALSDADYQRILAAIESGFQYEADGKTHTFRKNPQLAALVRLQAVLGLRVSDLLQLRLCDIIPDGERFRLDIIEKKTKKTRRFTVPDAVRTYIVRYCYDRHIPDDERIFPVTQRGVQKQLAVVSRYLGLEDVSTHSFRKRFATRIYRDSKCDIRLVQELLQHSSPQTTSRYIGIGSEELERALETVSNDLYT